MISSGITSMDLHYLDVSTVYEIDRMRKDPNDRIPLSCRLLSSTVVLFVSHRHPKCVICNIKVRIWDWKSRRKSLTIFVARLKGSIDRHDAANFQELRI